MRVSLRTWHWLHTWSSLVCTLFLLLLCITGLPLIFHDELDAWLDPAPPYAMVATDAARANLDLLAADAQSRYPRESLRFVFVDDERPRVIVWLAPSPGDDKTQHGVEYDARTGQLRLEIPAGAQAPLRFTDVMFELHSRLYADLPGELFLGAMGLAFVISVVSGIVLYRPFMKRIEFGTVRHTRGARIRWLDVHNLLGIATATWLLVVGATGVMNELATPLFGLWQATDVASMLESYRGQPAATKLASLQGAYQQAGEALPGSTSLSVVYPGDKDGSPHHYLIWTKGATSLTSRLFTPVLVDAQTGRLSAVMPMPWYLRTLEVSRPLHFGDYGGVPLKALWALFDLVAIVVLVSGVYLWFARRETVAARIARLENQS